jgi:D-lactate dehydrogenase (cytochrome)
MALPGPLLTDLAALLGPRLSTTVADRALHAQSESYMTAGQPDAVVYPTSTAINNILF